MKPNKFIKYISLALLVCLFASCSKMDATYSEFLKKGETIYIGKADSVKSYAGKNRLKLSWLFIGDPKISKYKIYWNNRTDSIIQLFQRNPGVDSVNAIINSLKEGIYNFEIFSFDNLGNTSIKVEAQGIVYGAEYQASLLNRGLKKASILSGTSIVNLEWLKSDITDIGVNVNYTGIDGNQHKLFVPKDEIYSNLIDYKSGTSFNYRTLFLPEANAIDTFLTAYKVIIPVVIYPELDKSKFKEYPLPTDIGSAMGWILPYLWDGKVTEGNGYRTSESSLPLHFSFDLGVTAVLHEMKIWQRQVNVYNRGNFKKFEIWGSTNPAVDGSFTGWTKLLDGESIKPSELPLGSLLQSDINYANAGELFKFPEGTPPVRYIRFNVLQTWSSTLNTYIMEASFWGN